MRASATTKLNALRMMVASGVIRSAYNMRDDFIYRQNQIPTENPATAFDHLSPINVLVSTTRLARGHNHVSHFATLL